MQPVVARAFLASSRVPLCGRLPGFWAWSPVVAVTLGHVGDSPGAGDSPRAGGLSVGAPGHVGGSLPAEELADAGWPPLSLEPPLPVGGSLPAEELADAGWPPLS